MEGGGGGWRITIKSNKGRGRGGTCQGQKGKRPTKTQPNVLQLSRREERGHRGATLLGEGLDLFDRARLAQKGSDSHGLQTAPVTSMSSGPPELLGSTSRSTFPAHPA